MSSFMVFHRHVKHGPQGKRMYIPALHKVPRPQVCCLLQVCLDQEIYFPKEMHFWPARSYLLEPMILFELQHKPPPCAHPTFCTLKSPASIIAHRESLDPLRKLGDAGGKHCHGILGSTCGWEKPESVLCQTLLLLATPRSLGPPAMGEP